MKKMKMTKKGWIITGIVAFWLILLCCFLWLILKPAYVPPPIVLNTDRANLELGQSVEEIKSQITDNEDTSALSFDLSKVNLAAKPDIPAVGEYALGVLDNGESIGTITLYVNDTKAPVFTKAPTTIQLDEGASFDVSSHFKAEDADSITLQANLDDVDLNTAGAYEASVTATDASGNATSVRFTIQVVEAAGLIQVTTDEGTIVKDILIVNKKNPLPETYDPGEDPEAAAALRQLIAAMQKEGLDVSDSYSGYRTWQSQKTLYDNYVAQDGQQAADTYSARPGYSEHQTGLTFDLKHTDGSLLQRDPEATWLANHCAEYGFIIRYPEGKEDITGYSYEPWHIRYIGEQAKEIMDSGLTLEEYLDVPGGDYA